MVVGLLVAHDETPCGETDLVCDSGGINTAPSHGRKMFEDQ